jgi:putative membrane protein
VRVAFAFVIAACGSSSLKAHAETSATEWTASIWDIGALSLLIAGGVLYALGSRRLFQRGVARRRAEVVAFWVGLCALLTAVGPALDAAAARRFSSHMVQHELLMRVGAPLLIAGRPIVAWLWALPARWRLRAGTWLVSGAVGRGWQVLTAPFTAWALHGAVIWIWHTPALYEAAVTHESIHAFQHATFVGTAVLFWWGLVYGRYGRAAYGASVLYVFTTMMHTGALGATFALSRSPFYDVYRQRAAEAGVDAIADQQLAGVYMWVPSGLILTVFGLALLVAWLAESDRRAKWRVSERPQRLRAAQNDI